MSVPEIAPGSQSLPQANQTLPFEIPKPISKIQSILEVGQTAIGIAQSIAPMAEKVGAKLPKPVNTAATGSADFYNAAMGIFAIPQLISDIHKAILATNIVDRTKSICKAVINAGAIVGSANGILGGLKTIEVIAKDALPWTSVINNVLFPLQFLSLGLSAHDLSESHANRKEILANIKEPRKELEGRTQDLTEACQYIMKNKDHLRKVLVLSKKTHIELRAEKVMNGITSANAEVQKQALEEGDALMKILRRRVNTKYNLEVAKLAVNVTAVATAGISIVVPPNPVTLGAGAICGLASLTLYGLEKLLINKDPFSEPRDVWHEKMIHRLREFVYSIPDAVEKVALETISSVKETIHTLENRFRTLVPVAS